MLQPRAVLLWRNGEAGIATCELALCGSLIVDHGLRLYLQGPSGPTLEPRHFESRDLGEVFRSVMAIRRPDEALVLADLDAKPAPRDGHSWFDVVSMCTYHAVYDDDAVKEYAAAIREAYVQRRLGTLERRSA